MLKVSYLPYSKDRWVDVGIIGGFVHSLSVFYSSIYFSGKITLFDDYDASGTVLASVDLDRTPSNPHHDPTSSFDTSFSPFFPVTLNFTGTAYSARFQGKGSAIFFDDVAMTLLVGASPTGLPTSSPTNFNAGEGRSEHSPTPSSALTGLPSMVPTGYPTVAASPLSPHPRHKSSAPVSSPHEPSTSTRPSSTSSASPSIAPISSPHESSTSNHPSSVSSASPSTAPISSPSGASVSIVPTGLPTFYYVNLTNGTTIEFIDKNNNSIGALDANGVSSAKGGSSVSVAEIAGIAVGGVVFIAGVIVAVFYYTSGSAVVNSGEALRRTSDYALNSGIQIGHGQPVNWGQGAEGTSDMFVL